MLSSKVAYVSETPVTAACGQLESESEQTMITKRKRNQIDKQIEATFYRTCGGVQLNVLDIGKVFAAGRTAAESGGDIEAAVLAAVAVLRQN